MDMLKEQEFCRFQKEELSSAVDMGSDILELHLTDKFYQISQSCGELNLDNVPITEAELGERCKFRVFTTTRQGNYII